MKHILVVTGSRDADREACEREINRIVDVDFPREIWHGDCPTGADMAAHLRCNQFIKERAWPANWKELGKGAGPIRNREMMVAASQQEGRATVLALPAFGAKNRGTMNAISTALGVQLNVVVRWVP